MKTEAVQRIGGHLQAARTFMRVRSASPAEITAADVGAWAALEAEALQPNAYMSPHFVLPALRHLDSPPGVKILLAERIGAGSAQVVGVVAMRSLAGARLLLVPHHAIYQSRHSFLGAPLLHREFAAEAADALCEALVRHRSSTAGLTLPNVDPAGPLLATLERAWRARGLTLQTTPERQRATLIPSLAGPDSYRMLRKCKDLERCQRRLAARGELEWLFHREVVDDEIVESFLRLEHCGWKGREGTSLRSRPADEAFFREMVTAFAREGRAWFTEVRLNGQTIASTANLVSAHAGFAFKIGWDESFRKYCVGMLNDAELVNKAPEVCGDLTDIDSGSSPDSYIEMLWPHRRRLVTTFLPYSRTGQLAWQGMQSLRSMRRSALAWTRSWRPASWAGGHAPMARRPSR